VDGHEKAILTQWRPFYGAIRGDLWSSHHSLIAKEKIMGYEATGQSRAKKGIAEFAERCGEDTNFATQCLLRRTGLFGYAGLADACRAGIIGNSFGENALASLSVSEFERALHPDGTAVEGEGLI
jgi:hypothetical protein